MLGSHGNPMVDWKEAFPRQCSTLGFQSFSVSPAGMESLLGGDGVGADQSFIDNRVRPSQIIISYFEDRQMIVRWHGKESSMREMPGGIFGIWSYLRQSNNSADKIIGVNLWMT